MVSRTPGKYGSAQQNRGGKTYIYVNGLLNFDLSETKDKTNQKWFFYDWLPKSYVNSSATIGCSFCQRYLPSKLLL